MNDEHVNAAVIIWFLLWLVKHSSSSSLRRPAGLCWRRSSALSSTCCRRLRHRCRSSDWSNLLYEIWKRDLKKGQREVFCVRRCCWARGFTSCPTVWQQTWSDLLTETLTMTTHSWQDVILLFIPPADTSCYTFTQTHTSKQSDVRPERFSLVVWITFCLQLPMEAESLILRVGSSRRLTMRKDEGRAGETLTRVDAPENRADRSDRIHSWWRLKTVPVERKHRTWQNLSNVSRTKPERSDPSSDQSQTPAESGLSRSDQSPTGRPDQQECSRTSWFCWTSCADNKQLPVESCLNSAQSWSNWWHCSNMIDENQSAANEWEDRKWPQSSCNHTELCDAFTLINKFHNVC